MYVRVCMYYAECGKVVSMLFLLLLLPLHLYATFYMHWTHTYALALTHAIPAFADNRSTQQLLHAILEEISSERKKKLFFISLNFVQRALFSWFFFFSTVVYTILSSSSIEPTKCDHITTEWSEMKQTKKKKTGSNEIGTLSGWQKVGASICSPWNTIEIHTEIFSVITVQPN